MEPIRISLAAARVNAGMSQQEVADKLEVSKKTLIKWEKGRATPAYPYVYTMSHLYDIPMDNLILPIESTERGLEEVRT